MLNILLLKQPVRRLVSLVKTYFNYIRESAMPGSGPRQF